jgi:hypothetical protein
MTCSRQHFEMIARVLRETEVDEQARERLTEAFASELYATNPRFDRQRFIRRSTEVAQ